MLARQKETGPDRKLCTFVSDQKLPLYGGEPILRDGQTVGLVTSTGYGHTVKKQILLSYLDRALWEETSFDVEVFGERHTVQQVNGPLYDPNNERLKS